MAKKMWKFKTKNFTVVWEISPDSFDSTYMEKDLARECRQKIRSGEWKCFNSEIRVIENVTKKVIGQAFLGQSIYADPSEFRDHFGMNAKGHGSYFSDMVREAIAEARQCFAKFQAATKEGLIAQQKILAIELRTQAHA
ncbi:MAG: hypothetical protein PHV02_07185 [Rhodocyclaceae bacterium]|nr:hypothetical protein [Rhodocyclaceae bacterium]